ncbi:MAG: hypothetical protein IPL04_05140 [Chitinophagaceae bacterium]|nr:hypothetical protein [Chitinophagaceae bacterium]
MHDIAQLQAIRLESLQELNWLKKNNVPAVGEKLSLKEINQYAEAGIKKRSIL